MEKLTNYKKKAITGKRTHIVLSQESYKALKKIKSKYNISSTTAIIEYLLLAERQEARDDFSQKLDRNLTSAINLINFNKKIYLDMNATFSNINQIAYKLNLASLNGTLDTLDNDELNAEITQALALTRQDLADLRVILKHLIVLLQGKQKTLETYTQGADNASIEE